MIKNYYMSINPLTNNWCISKTEDISWTITGIDNLIFDSGWLNISKAVEIIKNYCKEQSKLDLYIKVYNNGIRII